MHELHFISSRKQRSLSAAAKTDSRAQTFAVYGAFLLIAAIVFGTLSFRPF